MPKFSNRKREKYQTNFFQDREKEFLEKKQENQNFVKKIDSNSEPNDSNSFVNKSLPTQVNNESNLSAFRDLDCVEIEQNPKDDFYEQETEESTNIVEKDKQIISFEREEPRLKLEPIIKDYYQQKKYNECIAKLKKLLQLEPNNKKAIYWLGMNYVQKDNYTEAIKNFTIASSRSSTDEEDVCCVEALFWLGEIYRNEEQLKLASDRYQQFLQLAPQHPYMATALQHLSKIKIDLLCNL